MKNPYGFFFRKSFFSQFVLIHMRFDTFSQNISMAYLIQGQGHDGSAFDEEYLNSIRGIFFLLEKEGISIL